MKNNLYSNDNTPGRKGPNGQTSNTGNMSTGKGHQNNGVDANGKNDVNNEVKEDRFVGKGIYI